MAELDFSDEQWRAVTMASAVVAELAAQAAGVMSSPAHTQIKLQLIPIVPAGWNLTHRRATGMWLKQKAAQYGWSEDRIIVPDEGGRLEDETPSAVLKRLAHNAAIVNTPLLAMVVACASHIGDETVARWAADGSLFTSSQPQGQIPGEGAAGVLVTNQASLADAATIALLDGIEEAQRDLSADETKRSDPKLLGELSERALKSSGASASNVGMLIADTGHRSSRALELMAHVAAHMPQLDEADAVVRVGVASGTCSDVPFITVLALAHHYVVEHEASVLCVSNEDPYRRVVMLMRPPIPLP
jgi:hypothetical protein